MATGPLRIRVVSHQPLPPLKAWLPIPSPAATVGDLAKSVKSLLGGSEVELELQGFALFPDSPCASVLDFANDVVDIKAAITPLAAPPTSSFSAPLKTATFPVPVPVKPTSSSESSSSDSDSSDSEDSEDDGPPPSQSSKLPPPNIHRIPAHPPPAKRVKLDNQSSSEEDSSSDSRSSSSSSSDSSSSDSDSDSEDEDPSSKAVTKSSTGAAGNQKKPLVPPGDGLLRTKKRNQRKRMLKAGKAANGEGATSSVQLPSPALSTTPPLPTIAQSTSSAFTQPQPSTSKLPKLVSDPYLDYQLGSAIRSGKSTTTTIGTDKADKTSNEKALTMFSLATGNKNRKKKIKLPSNGSSQSLSTKTTFFPDLPPHESIETPGKTPSSPRFTPSSPSITPAEFVPDTIKRGSNLLPSQRTDLPPNLVVTVVNVERDSWTPGVGKVVEGTSRDYVPILKLSPLKGLVGSQDQGMEIEDESLGEIVVREGDDEWKDWPTDEKVLEKWDALQIASEKNVKIGSRVATKVLEFSTVTFTPALSLKTGILLSSPSDTTILRIKLQPVAQEVVDEEEYYDEDDEGEEYEDGENWERKTKFRFGEPLDVDEGEDQNGEWEGEWGDVRVI